MQDHVCHNAENIMEMKSDIRTMLATIADNKELVKTTQTMAINLELYTQKSDLMMQQNKERMEKLEDKHLALAKEQGERIGKLEKRPGEKWEKAAWIVIAALLTGLASMALLHFW